MPQYELGEQHIGDVDVGKRAAMNHERTLRGFG
jgi:hypothetical protein